MLRAIWWRFHPEVEASLPLRRAIKPPTKRRITIGTISHTSLSTLLRLMAVLCH